ncbi:MAG: glycerophosphodiester phosphodiesterase [Actinomycetales bacterium]|uniref:glycerophosphodiester phosphodiesterase n=1 Tax=uncultured Salinibacterium sp. TaxID=459274 RepID=UPI0030D738AC|tara:strand:+ start:2390 stop:3157 length:768 start_codon:yes stop_codon:yes gene_type:complete
MTIPNASRIIAHRGASAYAPENTLAAFELAVDMGATKIELDVDVTRDGHLVVMHDPRVDRTTDGVGWVRDFTLAELRALKCDRGFEGQFARDVTYAPTLAEVLAFARERNVWVNIETKDFTSSFSAVNDRVAEEVVAHDWVDATLISSINHRAMAGFVRSYPQFATAIAFIETFADLPGYARRCGATVLHPHFSLIDERFVAEAREHGLGINVWTVDDDATADRILDFDVDAIMTNRPDVGVVDHLTSHSTEAHE